MARPGDEIVKALRRQLAAEIVRALPPRAEFVVAPSFGIPQPRMSELNRGLVDRCSMEWLIRRIHRMGGSVTVTVELEGVERRWSQEVRARNAARHAAKGHHAGHADAT